MIFGKKRTEKEKREQKRAKNKRKWYKKLNKLIFLAGLTIAFKGLKGWLWGKKPKKKKYR